MIIRVGIISALVLSLVGYAMKVTYESVYKNGVVKDGDFYRVELKAMSNFEMDQRLGTVQDIPAPFRELDGKKVIFEGEVAATGMIAGAKTDELVVCYSVAKCCVSGAMKVQHFVLCSPAAGRRVSSFGYGDAVKVYGTLHIKAKQDGGTITSIFQMDVDKVEPLS